MAYTIDTSHEAEIKVKGSKFIALIFRVGRVEDAMNRLNDVRALHPKATHHCWAYKVGCPVTGYRMSDDGEPSGTAGKPIFGQLEAFDVTNILCVVVRYFGGTLLGTGGLIKAYKDSAKEVLTMAGLTEIKPEYLYKVTFDYLRMPMVMEAAKRFPGRIIEKQLDQNPFLILSTEREDEDYLIPLFKSYVLGVEVDHAATLDTPDFKIEKYIQDA